MNGLAKKVLTFAGVVGFATMINVGCARNPAPNIDAVKKANTEAVEEEKAPEKEEEFQGVEGRVVSGMMGGISEQVTVFVNRGDQPHKTYTLNTSTGETWEVGKTSHDYEEARQAFLEQKFSDSRQSSYNDGKVYRACWHYMLKGCDTIFLGSFEKDNVMLDMYARNEDGKEHGRWITNLIFKNDSVYLLEDMVSPQGREVNLSDPEFINLVGFGVGGGDDGSDFVIGGIDSVEDNRIISTNYINLPDYRPGEQVVIFARKLEGEKFKGQYERLYHTHLQIDWARDSFNRFITEYAEGAKNNFKDPVAKK